MSKYEVRKLLFVKTSASSTNSLYICWKDLLRVKNPWANLAHDKFMVVFPVCPQKLHVMARRFIFSEKKIYQYVVVYFQALIRPSLHARFWRVSTVLKVATCRSTRDMGRVSRATDKIDTDIQN